MVIRISKNKDKLTVLHITRSNGCISCFYTLTKMKISSILVFSLALALFSSPLLALENSGGLILAQGKIKSPKKSASKPKTKKKIRKATKKRNKGKSSLRAEKKVTFKTTDGWTLTGFYRPPKRGRPVAVCLHGLGANKGEWKDFSEALHKRGWGYLLYDARGHSESKMGPGGERDYQTFSRVRKSSMTPTEWEDMVLDADAAVKYLQKRGIKTKRVGLVGASLGANIAITYAAKNKEINFVVLLSPGSDYQGVKSRTAITKYGDRPLILAASRQDMFSYRSTRMLMKWAGKGVSFLETETGHGVHLLDAGMVKTILSFCRQNNIAAIAEGVESENELATLVELRVDAAQGYFLGLPSPELLKE